MTWGRVDGYDEVDVIVVSGWMGVIGWLDWCDWLDEV